LHWTEATEKGDTERFENSHMPYRSCDRHQNDCDDDEGKDASANCAKGQIRPLAEFPERDAKRYTASLGEKHSKDIDRTGIRLGAYLKSNVDFKRIRYLP
jgi:hypothetical protein